MKMGPSCNATRRCGRLAFEWLAPQNNTPGGFDVLGSEEVFSTVFTLGMRARACPSHRTRARGQTGPALGAFIANSFPASDSLRGFKHT